VEEHCEVGTFDLCVVLHGLGPGSRWAARCTVGDPVEISRCRALPIALDRSVEAHLFFGDETSIASAEALIRALPPEAIVLACFESSRWTTVGPSPRLPAPKRFAGWIVPGDPARCSSLGSRAKASRPRTPQLPT
jgi:NADPH-dependent ferric siderophore reductase